MPIRETAKQRAQRIDRRVLKGRRWIERGRFILAGIAALVVAGWWGAGMCFRRADVWASPGALSAVHATWTNDCKVCHTDFQAIRDDALLASSDSRSIADNKCQCCHVVAIKDDPLGPFGHHALNKPLYDIGCATCHHEHRGSSQLLARTSDDTCTMCHARSDLAHLATQPPAIANLKPVSQFAAEGQHPYFRSLGDPESGAPKPVPRRLKFARFSHHLHMTPGMAQDSKHVPVLTLGQLNEADRPRYKKAGQTDSSFVELDCSSCHQLQSSGFQLTKLDGLPAAVLPANSSGAYMLPITYENQCQACHGLTVEPCAGVPGGDTPEIKGKPCETVPHRLSAAQLTEKVAEYWAHRYFKINPKAQDRLLPPLGRSSDPESVAAKDWIKLRFEQSASHLKKVCSECHQWEPSHGNHAETANFAAGIIPQVAPVEISQKFLTHARFDHLAHRAVDCRSCHQDAYPEQGSGGKAADHSAEQTSESAAASLDEAYNPEPKESTLMIANRDKCLECHSPRNESGATAIGGARFDCAECHRYHNHDNLTSNTPACLPQ